MCEIVASMHVDDDAVWVWVGRQVDGRPGVGKGDRQRGWLVELGNAVQIAILCKHEGAPGQLVGSRDWYVHWEEEDILYWQAVL